MYVYTRILMASCPSLLHTTHWWHCCRKNGTEVKFNTSLAVSQRRSRGDVNLTSKCVCVYVYACECVCVCACIRKYVRTYLRMYVCMYVCMCVCM